MRGAPDGARTGLAVCLGQPLDSVSPRQMTKLKEELAQKCKSACKIGDAEKRKLKVNLDPITGLAQKCKPGVTVWSQKQKIIPIILYPGRKGRWEIWTGS